MRGSTFLATSAALYLIYVSSIVQGGGGGDCSQEGNASEGYRVKHCPEGWVRYGTSKCFKFFSTGMAFSAALQACESLDSTLACLVSHEEHVFINSYIIRQYETTAKFPNFVWLGGEARASRWFWTDFSPFKYASWHPAGFMQKWSDGQSIAIGTARLYVNTSSGSPNQNWGKMFSLSGESTVPYICQKQQTDTRVIIKI